MKNLYTTLSFVLATVGFAQQQNYVKTTVYKQPTTTSNATPSASQATQSIAFFDGLGRPIQQVASKQSGTGKNMVTPIEYDDYGRQSKEYLPYESNATGLDFEPNALSDVLNFAPYQGQSPASEKLFEASPLNRVLKQSAPGASWAMGSGREIKFDYQTNGANEVIRLNALATWNAGTQLYDIAFQNLGNYAAGELYKNIVKDENWTSGNEHTTQEFKDKEGRVVLKRTYGTSDQNGSPLAGWHDTYYVYDQFGNLTYVVPPLANPASPNLGGLCYQYKYDYRNRLVEKKLPGKQWEFIVYDRLDRPVATGPAFTPFGGEQTGWLATKYDAFGRVAYTGWYTGEEPSEMGRKNLQEERNSQTTDLWETQNTITTIDNISVGYTNNAFPTNKMIVLSASYYDSYNFPGAPTSFTGVESEPIYYNNTQQPKGMPTGSWTRVLTSLSEYLGETTYMLYDRKGRAIRTHKTNYLGGHTIVDNKLDFMGKALYTVTRHKRVNAAEEIYTKDIFSYTEQDRLDTHLHQIGASGVPQLLSKNEYDALGQLVRKSVGGTDATGQSALQKVDYSHNIRGWLKEINKVDNLLQGTDPADLFAFKINYDSMDIDNNNVRELYNGNIAETFWRTNSDNILRSYGYQYDALNRLNKAFYFKETNITNAYNEDVSYDKNGNIITLFRWGHLDTDGGMEIDNLDYKYNSDSPNQLAAVIDTSMSPEGFMGTGGGLQFQYDANGNLIRDDNKGLYISYNHLNLPVTITFGNGNTIGYLYDAGGTKSKKTIFQSGVELNTDYLDGFHYFNAELQFFPTAEGYIRRTFTRRGDVDSYVFNYIDHLGNIRVSFTENPEEKALTIIEENHYYPFGLKHKNYNQTKYVFEEHPINPGVILEPSPLDMDLAYNYKYNGKEFQDELGLNLYDYGARNYDPAIGRWMNIDPLAERRSSWSVYGYCLNNPVLRLDPNGLTDFIFNKKTGEVKQVGEKNDDPDRILKTKRGKVDYKKNGEAKVAIDGIEKGILENGQNFKNNDQVISIGGKDQPSVDGVKSLTLQLSNYLGKEIKGFSYSSNGSGKVTDMVLGKYKDNSYTQSFGTTRELAVKYGSNYSPKNIVQEFHTHPDGQLGATQSNPNLSQDVKALQMSKSAAPNASFIILYSINGQSKPAEYDYTHNYNPK